MRVDEVVGELLRAHVAHPRAGVEAAGVVADRVQQVGLAQPGLAVDEQRVVRLGRRLGHRDRGGVREPVARADDEGVEGVLRVEPARLGVAPGCAAGPAPGDGQLEPSHRSGVRRRGAASGSCRDRRRSAESSAVGSRASSSAANVASATSSVSSSSEPRSSGRRPRVRVDGDGDPHLAAELAGQRLGEHGAQPVLDDVAGEVVRGGDAARCRRRAPSVGSAAGRRGAWARAVVARPASVRVPDRRRARGRRDRGPRSPRPLGARSRGRMAAEPTSAMTSSTRSSTGCAWSRGCRTRPSDGRPAVHTAIHRSCRREVRRGDRVVTAVGTGSRRCPQDRRRLGVSPAHPAPGATWRLSTGSRRSASAGAV